MTGEVVDLDGRRHQPTSEHKPKRKAKALVALGSILGAAAIALGVSGTFSGKRAPRSESSTAKAQALAQDFATRISKIALRDSANPKDKVSLIVTNTTDPSIVPTETELSVKAPHYTLRVDYLDASGINTDPQNVDSVSIDYSRKAQSLTSPTYDTHSSSFFYLYNSVGSGAPGWTIAKSGVRVSVPHLSHPLLTNYNTDVKAPRPDPLDPSQIALLPLTSVNFNSVTSGAQATLHAIEAEAIK